ncbi:thermonuclease family protein [Mesorhizobium sp. B2-4-15]|uniref:thermonuclease family protein n=1 Tax=Mesorhizobium sp. B2-4-15 TaxID=2589934 RepID=UPI00114D924A|nr:thermonuclease family protein [Mesorhizobium sp. B2-4-15]TPK72142.1 thermonuclease family protein [Mesorhizobium sp. B2-4-15]
MKSKIVPCALTALIVCGLPSPVFAADLARGWRADTVPTGFSDSGMARLAGRVTVVDGRTLWFPDVSETVRLDGIDACDLPQWAFDPKQHGDSLVLKPVPCGALSKAWLKRLVGDSPVVCRISAYSVDGALTGRCIAGGRDLAVGMLRAGWARVQGPSPASSQYWKWQRYAMSARYGMWATYVIDPDEWRAKAVDRTLGRKPLADLNLLGEREQDISPPFLDAGKRPARSDR